MRLRLNLINYLSLRNIGSYDEHWKPSSLYCSVCATLDYTNILHFENIQSEERFFVETLNSPNVVQPRY